MYKRIWRLNEGNTNMVYRKTMAEMNNGKIVSGSKYIVLLSAVLRSTRKGGWVRKHDDRTLKTIYLAVADCALHRLSLYPSKILNIQEKYNVSWKVSRSAL